MCPPFCRLSDVVDKILADGAHGVLLIPVWMRKAWFHALGRVSYSWWDVPDDADIIVDSAGRVLPQARGTRLRFVAFNAFGHRTERDISLPVWMMSPNVLGMIFPR